MKPGNAPRIDNIPLEVFTHGDHEMNNCLLLLFLKIWETMTLQSDFRDANSITIFKKRDRENCSNYRGISL